MCPALEAPAQRVHRKPHHAAVLYQTNISSLSRHTSPVQLMLMLSLTVLLHLPQLPCRVTLASSLPNPCPTPHLAAILPLRCSMHVHCTQGVPVLARPPHRSAPAPAGVCPGACARRWAAAAPPAPAAHRSATPPTSRSRIWPTVASRISKPFLHCSDHTSKSTRFHQVVDPDVSQYSMHHLFQGPVTCFGAGQAMLGKHQPHAYRRTMRLTSSSAAQGVVVSSWASVMQ